MERIKPSVREIFWALTSEATYPDWDIDVLEKADVGDVGKVRSVLLKGLPLSEAEIELEGLEEMVKI